MEDVVVIGAGIAGSYVTRELMKYDLSVVLVDKENDVANQTTMANSAIVHAGYDAKPGSQKSYYNVRGNPMFDQVCQEMDVPFKRIGSLVVAFDEEDKVMLKKLHDQGLEAGIKEMSLIDGDEVRRLEPNLSQDIVGALYAKTAGIVSPFELAIALAENAVDNGAKLMLETKVRSILKTPDGYVTRTDKGNIHSKYVINCGGVFADEIARMVGDKSFEIRPRKGHYYVLDKDAGDMFHHTIFQCPSSKGKGVLITPTVHGNVLVGPDSDFVSDKDDLATDAAHLKEVAGVASRTSDKIPYGQVIRSFVGLRASSDVGDFVIGESKISEGFFHVGGFESPGLSSIPAVACDIVQMLVAKDRSIDSNANFNPLRRKVNRFVDMSHQEKKAIIEKDPSYGNMICRCEYVTEGEIVDCIHRNVGATTIKGVKKRTRPGMGRCQGGFCGPRVMEIISRELDIKMKDVAYDRSKAYIITKETKL